MTARIVTLTLSPVLDCSTRVPQLRPDEKLRCGTPAYAPGGGGINVARALQRLGGQALALFPVGGPSGEQLRALLSAEGVAHQALPVKGWTREGLNVRELSSGRQYRFVLPGASLSDAEQTQLLQLLGALPAFDCLVFSGSLPEELSADFLPRLLHLAQQRGARCVLDSSAEALRQGLTVGGLWLIKPNLAELAELVGQDLSQPGAQERAAGELLASGACEALLVSLGAEGALLATGDLLQRIPAPLVKKLSSVGAGDSLLAGMLRKLTAGAGWAEAARYGIAAGTAAIMAEGTQLCRLDDTERLFDWLQVYHP